MRVVFLLVLGLAIGIVGTVFTMNALADRNPLPHAVMVTMGYHRHQLQNAVKTQRCEATENLEQFHHMQMTAADINAAFPDAPQPFLDDASHLRNALQTAALSSPADCPALTAALKPVDAVCEDCHKQYR